MGTRMDDLAASPLNAAPRVAWITATVGVAA